MRVRFAPSPTGSLHIGGARTALYNYLLSKRNGGTFILRIEDTDCERNIAEANIEMLNDLSWLGLTWQEGPQTNGEILGTKGPYFQSERKEIYAKFAEQLVKKGLAYYCFMQDEELQELKEEQIKLGAVHHVQSPYRNLPYHEALEKLKTHKATIRIKVPDKEYSFNDAVRGLITLKSNMISDFVILRSSGMPVYNYCCVIDDHLMGITDVLRGEEHLSNTLKQLIIYDLLDFKPPNFAHLSVIVGEDRKKLSKREASVSVKEFRQDGFEAEALLNFIALLGWSHPEGTEILSLKELEQHFDLSRVHASSAYFDRVKLKWMNAQYLRKKTEAEILDLLQDRNFNIDIPKEIFTAFWQAYKADCETLEDVEKHYKRLYTSPLITSKPENLEGKNVWQAFKNILQQSTSTYFTLEEAKSMLKTCQQQSQVSGKQLFMPLRFALLGILEGSDLAVVLTLLKKEEIVSRLEYCLTNL